MIIMAVLAVGCVVSQSTTNDNKYGNESPSGEQLELQLALLQQQHQQMAHVLSDIVAKLNQLQTTLTNRPEVSAASPANGGKTVKLANPFNAGGGGLAGNIGMGCRIWLCSKYIHYHA